MSQSDQFHAQWAHLRDHARPVRASDVAVIADDRKFGGMTSAAHRARLTRERPVCVPAPPPRPIDASGARRRINDAIRAADPVRAAIARARTLEYANRT